MSEGLDLQHDLDAYKEGYLTNDHLLDCLWCELYGSINGAEIDDQAITHEHAQYLRREVMEFFEEEGLDLDGLDEDSILEADEVFDIGDGRYLIIEG